MFPYKPLSPNDILSALQKLGLDPGDRVLVHSSLVAVGEVEGGADAIIDALVEAVGPDGLVVVPTFACAPPFDRRTSATALGAVADRFWRRSDAVRSLHPTHSVAAIGKGAEELIRDHEKAPTAYAEGTPYYNLAKSGGKILLLGVDQDRNTTLHAAEALAESPYLHDIKAGYIDDEGNLITIPVAAMAGPHRNFIGLDRLFRERGIMKIGTIGKAVCRLIDAGSMLDAALEALRADPAAVLCDNPACADCVMQRGRIKAARLKNERFILAAVASDISDDLDEVLSAIQSEGIAALEVTPEEFERYEMPLRGLNVAAIRGAMTAKDGWLADSLGVPLIVAGGTKEDFEKAVALEKETTAEVLIENDGTSPERYVELYNEMKRAPSIAFNPAKFAQAGAKPFLEVFYHGSLRKRMKHFYIADGTFGGVPTLPGMGNGEVKEIISMLRCRSYGAVMTIRSHNRGVEQFRQAAGAFWRLLDTM